MSDFWAADKSVENMANELIAQFHPEISTASTAFIFKEAASNSEMEAGTVVVAKKVTGFWKTLTNDTDFVLVIAANLWADLSPTQQTAVLDSALTCCTIKVDENGEQKIDKAGNPVWALQPHDIVEHSVILQRYGLDVLKDAGNCVRSFLNTSKPTLTIEAESEPVIQKVDDSDDYDDPEDVVADPPAKKAKAKKK